MQKEVAGMVGITGGLFSLPLPSFLLELVEYLDQTPDADQDILVRPFVGDPFGVSKVYQFQAVYPRLSGCLLLVVVVVFVIDVVEVVLLEDDVIACVVVRPEESRPAVGALQ